MAAFSFSPIRARPHQRRHTVWESEPLEDWQKQGNLRLAASWLLAADGYLARQTATDAIVGIGKRAVEDMDKLS